MVKCAICKKRFDSVSSLESHHKSVHKGQRFTLLQDNSVRNRILALVTIVLVLGGVGGYFAFQSVSHSARAPNSSTTTTASNWVGLSAPSFVSPTVNPVGGNFNLSDYRGKSNVLILFNEGLSCSPCLQQMVEMNNDYSKFRALNTVIVAITSDSSSDLSQWAKLNGIGPLIVISDQNLKIDIRYGTLGPSISMMGWSKPGHTFFFVDTTGTIRWRADYGPGIMYVQESEIFANLNRVLNSSS